MDSVAIPRMVSWGDGDNLVTLGGLLYWCMLAAGTVGPGTVISCARYNINTYVAL